MVGTNIPRYFVYHHPTRPQFVTVHTYYVGNHWQGQPWDQNKGSLSSN